MARTQNLIFVLGILFGNSFAQDIRAIEIRKDNLWKKGQKLFHEDKNYNEALKCFLEFAEICESQNWTCGGDGYDYAAKCYKGTNRLLNALKTYKKAKLAYEREGKDSEAIRINRYLHFLNKDIQRNLKWEI